LQRLLHLCSLLFSVILIHCESTLLHPVPPRLATAWRQAHWVLGFSVVKSMKSKLLQSNCPHSADWGNSNSGVALLVLITGRNIEPKYEVPESYYYFQNCVCVEMYVWLCVCLRMLPLFLLFCDIIGPSKSTGW
jgi:hypothetical protein